MVFTTSISVVVVIASSLGDWQEHPQSLEDRISKLLDDHVPTTSPYDRSFLHSRLCMILRPFVDDVKKLERALQQTRMWISLASVVDRVDEYRPLVAAHPELAPLVLPESFSQRAYDTVLAVLSAEITPERGALIIHRESQEVMRKQMSDLRAATEEMLLPHFSGSFGRDYLQAQLDAQFGRMLNAIGAPFHGIYRALTQEEYDAMILSLRKRVASLGTLEVNNRELVTEDFGRDLFAKAAEALDFFQDAFDPLFGIWDLNNPESGQLKYQLEEVEAEARVWVKAAKEANSPLEARRLAELALQQHRALQREKLRIRKNSGPSEVATTDEGLSVPRPVGKEDARESGRFRGWVPAAILVIVALVFVGVNVWVIARRKRRAEAE